MYSKFLQSVLKYLRVIATTATAGTITDQKQRQCYALREFPNLFNNFANHYIIVTVQSPAALKQERVTVNIIKKGYAQRSPSSSNRLIMQLYLSGNVLCKTVNYLTFMQPFFCTLLYSGDYHFNHNVFVIVLAFFSKVIIMTRQHCGCSH